MFSAKAKSSGRPPSQAEQDAELAADEASLITYPQMVDEEKGLRDAESLLRNSDDGDRERTAKVRETAAPYLEIASRPLALAVRREQIAVELPKLHERFIRARERQAIARSVKTSEIALKLQPAQRAAVVKIATAAEALSRAMAEERAVRDELMKTAPLPSSRYLPMASPRIGGFDDWTSQLSQWRREMKALGYLT